MTRFARLGQDLGQAAAEARDLRRGLDGGGGPGRPDPAGTGGDATAQALRRLERKLGAAGTGKGSSPMSSTEFRALGKLEP
jgi:hypothetical protein